MRYRSRIPRRLPSGPIIARLDSLFFRPDPAPDYTGPASAALFRLLCGASLPRERRSRNPGAVFARRRIDHGAVGAFLSLGSRHPFEWRNEKRASNASPARVELTKATRAA